MAERIPFFLLLPLVGSSLLIALAKQDYFSSIINNPPKKGIGTALANTKNMLPSMISKSSRGTTHNFTFPDQSPTFNETA
jgi:hypothetical protein